MSDYYDHGSAPADNSFGDPAVIRAEFDLITQNISGKLPPLGANGDKIIAVNPGATALVALTTTGSGNAVRATSPTLITPALGTPSSGVATNLTGLPLSTGVTGTLPVANGGTGVTTSTGSGNVVLSSGPTLVAPILGTPASGVATNLTGLPLTTGVTGTLPVANGGTGIATTTAYSPVFTGTTATGAYQATLGPGTSGQVLTSSGAGVLPVWGPGIVAATDTTAGIVELATSAEVQAGTDTGRVPSVATMRSGLLVNGAVTATTSGTSIDFTGIPSWVKRITVMFNGISTNGASFPQILLGDSGGPEAAGYLGSIVSTNSGGSSGVDLLSSGFTLNRGGAATNVMHGSLVLTLLDPATNTWSANGNTSNSEVAFANSISGTKALSAALDRIRLTTQGGVNTFDAGSVNILYE
jgi:hypothetical protein